MSNALPSVIDIDVDRRSVKPGDYKSFKDLFVISTVIQNIETNSELVAADTLRGDDIRARNVIYNYLVSVIIASIWYDRKMTVENRYRWFYQCVTLVLIVALPTGVCAGMFYLLNGLKADAVITIPSAVTAVLTSLVGLQKAWGAWLDSHKRFGSRWRARAALRDIMYTDRDRWCGHAVSGSVLQPDFIDALALSIVKARTAIRAEQQAYFDTFDLPSLDLGSSLSGARTTANNIMQDVSKPISAISDAKFAVDSKRGEIDAMKGIIAGLQPGDASLQALSGNLVAAQKDLAVAQGKLSGLLASI